MIQQPNTKKPKRQIFLAFFISVTLLTASYQLYRKEMIRDTFLALYADANIENPYQDLLLGSSTIKHLIPERDLTCGNWLKRGIGNSQISDLLRYLQLSSLNIQPKKIILYAGENDLANGYNSSSTLITYQQLIHYLNSRFPSATLHILAIKPSPKRRDLHRQINILNKSLQQFAATDTRLFFHSAEWSDAIATNAPIFRADGVHLSPYGYRILTRNFNISCKSNNFQDSG